ncbi:hypothetical protein LCGC14_3114960 [marine sediment metagenome]|uniref:Uncharacterized protein n=1 Tax=marine sediment metagenome TaxID=412755 RepID=A0A0F8YBE7_9ZZZZ
MITQYQCPYCYREFSDYDDAYDCAVECASIDEVIQISICDYCKKTSNKVDEIEECIKK